MKVKKILMLLAVALCVAACSSDDEPANGGTSSGVKSISNLDASDYGSWTYLNLETGEMETVMDAGPWIYTDGTIKNNEVEPVGIKWHIAFHRYEIKTNGGSVLDTGLTDMEKVTSLPSGNYEADVRLADEDELSLTMDLSGMMTTGSVGYAQNPYVNKVLCSWVTRTETGSMPPVVYTPTNHVMVLKCNDGNWAKLQLTAAGNTETNKSGFLTFDYEFFAK